MDENVVDLVLVVKAQGRWVSMQEHAVRIKSCGLPLNEASIRSILGAFLRMCDVTIGAGAIAVRF